MQINRVHNSENSILFAIPSVIKAKGYCIQKLQNALRGNKVECVQKEIFAKATKNREIEKHYH